jgi:hypothetical protein
MECDGIEVEETRKKIAMEWNAVVTKLQKQERKL